ncbi:MAG: SH3 domain-containing protein [Caldilinea sp. CFX5]|nr:SH3 domain-containing protein [Caldilinea sp. CFX5]
MFLQRSYCRGLATVAGLLLITTLSGCGFLFGSAGPEPTPTQPPSESRALVPTFTPTSAEPPTAPPQPAPPTDTPTPAPAAPITTSVAAITGSTTASVTNAITATTIVTEPTATAAPQAKLTVKEQMINVRSGPGTTYGLVGSAEANQSFEIIAKNEAGDWWQICCVNGQQGWVFGELAQVENTGAVPVAANIAPPPVAAAPTATPAPAAAAPPTATPAPQVAAPPPAADPCATIGGDGCKFKLREGPKFAPNGGTEIKLQMIFVHSGVDGGQPQGSYFVAMFKDGQKLPIGDGVRSIAQSSNQGTLGAYNYEYKIGLDSIPGNTVAGNYVMYVLDGNGERDSRDISFTIPEGQGEVWIKWDQG